MLINNKTSKILSLWLIFVLSIVGLVIVIGIGVFYSSGTDVRTAQAIAMNNKIVIGISNYGHINEKVFDKDARITTLAGIGEEVMDGKDFYFNVTIYDSGYKEVKSFVLGNPDFEYQCRIPGKYYAKCKDSEFVLLNKTNPLQKFVVRVLTGVNQ